MKKYQKYNKNWSKKTKKGIINSPFRSFFNEGLIDELYEYTAPGILNGNDMENPINLDSSWNCINQKSLGNDKLVIYQKKEIECLVE